MTAIQLIEVFSDRVINLRPRSSEMGYEQPMKAETHQAEVTRSFQYLNGAQA